MIKYFIILITLLSVEANFAAHAAIDLNSPPTHHVGLDNFFRLGSYHYLNNPEVTANEYCAYLNSNKNACNFNSTDTDVLDYYDNSFMNAISSYDFVLRFAVEHRAIRPNDCITRHNEHRLRYSVIPGRGNYIIDGIHTRLSVTNVLEEFQSWRKNPTAQELCTSMNEVFEGNNEAIVTLMALYGEASPNLLKQLHLLTPLRLLSNANHEELPFEGTILDEQNRPLIIVSNENENGSYGDGPLHATVVEGMEYYRPTSLRLEAL